MEARTHSYGEHRDQFGELTLPAGAGPFPVAGLIHGGFWRERYDLRLEDALVADLASRGWAAWNLEYRRLGRRSGGGWPATFEDVIAGIDALADVDVPLDLERVVAIGHSAGGHLALWAAASAKSRVAATAAGSRATSESSDEPHVLLAGAVSQAGVADLREAARLGLSDSAAEALLGGSPDEVPERYDAASPIDRLPLGIPQLLVHGDADENVPVSLSRRYAERAGDACALVELPGGGHFEHLDPGSDAWRAVTDWLERR
jgi:acetyl esterase/lipase